MGRRILSTVLLRSIRNTFRHKLILSFGDEYGLADDDFVGDAMRTGTQSSFAPPSMLRRFIWCVLSWVVVFSYKKYHCVTNIHIVLPSNSSSWLLTSDNSVTAMMCKCEISELRFIITSLFTWLSHHYEPHSIIADSLWTWNVSELLLFDFESECDDDGDVEKNESKQSDTWSMSVVEARWSCEKILQSNCVV